MQRRHRLHRVCPPDRLGAGFRQAEVAHLALPDEVLDGAGNVFHRHLGIDPVLVVEVDVIGAKPLQAALDRLADLSRLAVGVATMLASLLIDIPAEFGGNDDLVAHAGEGFPDHLLVGPRAVGLGGIEEVHAALEGCVQQRDHFWPVGNVASLAVAHGAERQRRDFEALAEFALLHDGPRLLTRVSGNLCCFVLFV